MDLHVQKSSSSLQSLYVAYALMWLKGIQFICWQVVELDGYCQQKPNCPLC